MPPTPRYLLALVVSNHSEVGYVLAPYIIDVSSDVYQFVEVVSSEVLKNDTYGFSAEEKTMIQKLISTYDKNLCKNYSRYNSVRYFWESVDEAKFKMISDFLDKQFNAVLDIACAIGTPIFHRKPNYKQLYEADRVAVASNKVRPTFYFYLSPETHELSYTLKFYDGQKEVQLNRSKMVAITDYPAAVLISNVLYRFKNIASAKFKPFLSKGRIVVPPNVVPKYMETFVRQCIMNHYVKAYGFRIVKHEFECRAILKIEENVFGNSLRLFFAYGENIYQYGENRKTVDFVNDNGEYIFYTCIRQTEHEQHIADQLLDEGLEMREQNCYVPAHSGQCQDVQLIISWINEHIVSLKNLGIEFQTPETSEYYYGIADLQVEMSERPDWFDIRAVVVFDDCKVPFIKFLRYIRDGRCEYKLPNGKVFILPQQWFATWSDVAPFASEKDGDFYVQKLHMQLLPEDLMSETNLVVAEMKQASPERKGELHATLRTYQEEGFRWLKTLCENNRGGILADDMGLGKTLQVIALMSHNYASLPEGEEQQPSLIIMPVSLIHNWFNELRRFAPQLKVAKYVSIDRPRGEKLEEMMRENHVVLTSYGILRRDAELLEPFKFFHLIIDESQYIKNPTSKTYHALNKIFAQHKITMSGTPIENRLTDLWAQMNIVNPGLLGSLNFFQLYFEKVIQNQRNTELRSQKLRKLIDPFILRRTKEMVATELPPKTLQVVYCPMTTEQSDIYETEKSAVRNGILNVSREAQLPGQHMFIVLQALTRLRLIANHPQLTDSEYQGSSGKTEIVLQYIENVCAERHKMLVFSSFVRDLNLIAHSLTERGIAYSMLTGSTRNREGVIRDFQDSTEKNVFLISLKAGGVGLNLTCADYVFVLNPWWNPAAEEQAINRAHRIGQTKKVFVYKFITKDSIEEKIMNLQAKKLALANDFVASNNLVADLSVDELRSLVDSEDGE